MRSLLKVSAMLSRANSPRRLTQGPRLVETVTSGDVVTMRCANSLSPRPISLRMRAEAGLRRHHRLDGDGKLIRHRDARRLQAALAACARTARVRGIPAAARRASAAPRTYPIRGPGRMFIACAERFHLRRRHQAGMVVLVAGERQAEALDGVGDEAGRPVVLDRMRTPRAIAGRSWPPRLFISARKLGVGALLDQLGHVALVADLVVEPFAPGGAAWNTSAE